jgi:hypothetical protein
MMSRARTFGRGRAGRSGRRPRWCCGCCAANRWRSCRGSSRSRPTGWRPGVMTSWPPAARASKVSGPTAARTIGRSSREVRAGATGRVQHPAVGRQPGQEPLHEAVVHRLDLAPVGVEVTGQGVLLSLVDPGGGPGATPFAPPAGRRRCQSRSCAGQPPPMARLLFLSVLDLGANRLPAWGTWEGGQLLTLPPFVRR